VPTILDEVRAKADFQQFLLGLSERHIMILGLELSELPFRGALLAEGNDTLELLLDAKLSYSGVLPRTGDYFITAKRSATAKGTSRFRLAVTVR
jgi:hypothetical protein